MTNAQTVLLTDVQIGDTIDFGFQINSTLIVQSITELDGNLVQYAGKTLYGKSMYHNFDQDVARTVRLLTTTK